MEELTQAQQFTIWYERVCRDRDFAVRYFDLANRISDDRKAVAEMLDWIEGHVFELREGFSDEPMELRWLSRNGESHYSTGANLRDAISRAMESEKSITPD